MACDLKLGIAHAVLPEETMQPPAPAFSGRGIAKEPEAAIPVRLDAVVVTKRRHLALRLPPFARDPFRAVRLEHTMTDPPPDEENRRMIRHDRHGLDAFRRIENARRSHEVFGPCQTGCRSKCWHTSC